jgi:hypothetical protein
MHSILFQILKQFVKELWLSRRIEFYDVYLLIFNEIFNEKLYDIYTCPEDLLILDFQTYQGTLIF